VPPFLAAFLARWGALLASVLAALAFGWFKGCEHVTAQWDAANAAVLAQTVHEQARKQEVANDVQVKYVDRIRVIHDQLAAVPVALPPAVEAGCRIPAGSFGRLWNDANAATADTTPGDVPAARDAAVDADPAH